MNWTEPGSDTVVLALPQRKLNLIINSDSDPL